MENGKWCLPNYTCYLYNAVEPENPSELINEWEVDNKSPSDSFTLWFQKKKSLYSLRDIRGLILLSFCF